jgi:hypothetical protein
MKLTRSTLIFSVLLLSCAYAHAVTDISITGWWAKSTGEPDVTSKENSPIELNLPNLQQLVTIKKYYYVSDPDLSKAPPPEDSFCDTYSKPGIQKSVLHDFTTKRTGHDGVASIGGKKVPAYGAEFTFQCKIYKHSDLMVDIYGALGNYYYELSQYYASRGVWVFDTISRINLLLSESNYAMQAYHGY